MRLLLTPWMHSADHLQYDQFLTDIKTITGGNLEIVVPPTGLCLCNAAHADNCDTVCPLP